MAIGKTESGYCVKGEGLFLMKEQEIDEHCHVGRKKLMDLFLGMHLQAGDAML